MTSPLEARLAMRGQKQPAQRASYDELAVALAESSARNRHLENIVRSIAGQIEAGKVFGVEGPFLSAIKEAAK